MIIPRFVRRWFRAPYDGLRSLHAVQEGVLYRCGQPRPEQLDELITRLGLKTVVALRGQRDEDDSDSWEADERAVCERRGVEFVTIPFNHKNPPTRDQVDRFLNLTREPTRCPALVHCRIGRQRTGLFCALFRVHVQGMSPSDALAEMDQYGFDSGHRRHQLLLEAFHRLSR